jgi:outer membrane lipoprotein-sorting protein
VFTYSINSSPKIFVMIFALALIAGMTTVAQAQKTDLSELQAKERGIELINKAIAARGGFLYLNFKSLTATGQFTPYDKGLSQIPIQFLDIIVYPDKERVEFGKGKKKDRKIQVNTGKTGWIYDGEAETLKDQNEKQIQSFIEGREYDLDYILRSGHKEQGVEVRYEGREEVRPGERADVVVIQLKPEKIVKLWLNRNDHLPMSLIYEKMGDDGLTKQEVRFFQYVKYDGVNFPNIIDFYRDGIQESRINYQTIKLDAPVGEDLFAKPASAKAIK